MKLYEIVVAVGGRLVTAQVPSAIRTLAARYITASAGAVLAKGGVINSPEAYARSISERITAAYGREDWSEVREKTQEQLARWARNARRPGPSAYATIDEILDGFGSDDAVFAALLLAGHRRDDCACPMCEVSAGAYPKMDPEFTATLADLRRTIEAGAYSGSAQ